jgi:hypothetical protein
MMSCDPPTGEPVPDPARDDYTWQHVHKPEIETFIRELYAKKQAASGVERQKYKTFLTSLVGFTQKHAKRHVRKVLTTRHLDRDSPLLEKTDEARNCYWIWNTTDRFFN